MELNLDLIIEGWKGLPESGQSAFQVTINFWNYFSLRRFFDTYAEAVAYKPENDEGEQCEVVREFAKEGYLMVTEAWNPITDDYDNGTMQIISEHIQAGGTRIE